MVPVEFLIQSVLACKTVHAGSSTLGNSVRAQSKERMHTIYIEEGMMVTKLSVPLDWGTASCYVKTRVVICNYALRS